MASRILTKEKAVSYGRCREMCGYYNSTIRFHSYKYCCCGEHHDIEPIIAKGNRFDKVKAKW